MALVGCRMEVKRNTGCGMPEIPMAGCEIKIFRQERDLLILTGGTRFKIDGAIKDSKSQVKDVMRRTATLTRPDRDKHYIEWSGMAGMISKT